MFEFVISLPNVLFIQRYALKKVKLPELAGVPGMPLPPLPDGSMPLPPLPNPNASDALAALKMQMDED